MEKLAWSTDYENSIETIDFQHKCFFDIICKIQEVDNTSKDKKRILKIIRELVLYAQYHFLSEENYMEDIHYLDLYAHKQLHYRLIELLNIEINNFELGKTTITHFLEFTVNWFKNHTVNEDKKIAEFLKKK